MAKGASNCEKIIYNAKAYVSRGAFAEAVHIRNGTIAAVGRSAGLLANAPSAERVDAGGKLLLPGFYDSHQHLIMAGKQSRLINADCGSIDRLIAAGREKIAQTAPPEGSFVQGWGWDDEKLGRAPTRHDLDKISERHAIALSRRCGHASAVNTLALRRMGMDPVSHEGILRELEARALDSVVPKDSEEDLISFAAESAKTLRGLGVTSIASNDARGNVELIRRVYSKAFEDPESRVRVTLQSSISGEGDLRGYISAGYKTGAELIPGRLKFGPLKLFADGSLGSKTALMRKGYLNDPGNRGVAVLGREEILNYVKIASENAIGAAIHAIGDAAIENALSAYEAVTRPNHNPLRHGIVHCQITDAGILGRFAKNGILALVQPIFLGSDRHIVESRVGAGLAKTSYAWGTMEKLGIRTAYGTDSPVEAPNPFPNIAAAVGRYGYNMDECVDVCTAVDAYTIGSAYANFDEGRLGRIAPGYLADLILVDRDIFELPPEEIAKAKVLGVYSAGINANY